MERIISLKLRSSIFAKGNRRCRILTIGGFFVLSVILASAAMAQEYEAKDVDTKPKIIRQMPITYPTLAKRNGVEGRVVVRVLIGIKGKPEKMEIYKSEPEGIFDENAMKSLKYWQFRPGILNGELVPTWVAVPLTFQLDD
jgi:protein TonB